MNYLLKKLNEMAQGIEKKSKSERIRKYHKKGYKCHYEIGFGDFGKAKYVILSLNPGGEGKIKSDEKIDAYGTFNEYLKCLRCKKHPFGRNLEKILNPIGEGWKIPDEELYSQFFHANLSIFNSRRKEDDFLIEAKESKPILLEILKIRKLKAIICCGSTIRNDILYKIYKKDIIREEKIGRYKYTCCVTDVFTADKIRCVFIPHISGAWGIKDSMLQKIGKLLTKDLP